MDYFWDLLSDKVERNDNLRQLMPSESFIDDDGVTHCVFAERMFDNPEYVIPESKGKLFDAFLTGGSRHYPSDGQVPLDRVAEEVKLVFDQFRLIADNPYHEFHSKAVKVLSKGENNLLRGTMALYFRNITTRDWRRKRSTDDIDFWVWSPDLLYHVLSETGWVKNKETLEWEKRVEWINPYSNSLEREILIASNDLNLAQDFNAGSYITGTSLYDIISKKINRGHDVDLSDIINVAIVNNNPEPSIEWRDSWIAFEEAANTRSTRTIANMIALCSHSYAIARHLLMVGEAIDFHKDSVNMNVFYSNEEIIRVCNLTSHLLYDCGDVDPKELRAIIYQGLANQADRKKNYSANLKSFADSILALINSKIDYLGFVIDF